MEIKKNLGTLGSIQYSIGYYDVDMHTPTNVIKQHIHNEYEIYVNISGAVNFVCGDNIYPVEPRDVIINRPGEPHHCVYRENLSHKHYFMLFSCDKNDPLLSVFHDREIGVGNLIKLNDKQSFELVEICDRLSSDSEQGNLESGYYFIKMLVLLNQGTAGKNSIIPTELQEILAYISKNISTSLHVKELASLAHMSLSTFERQFKSYVGISPKQYITQRKLALASKMLANGYNVSETFESCGFADYSHFISTFKKRFGLSPYQYRATHQITQKTTDTFKPHSIC